MNLVAVAEEIQHRIIHIFGRDMQGRRATNGGNDKLNFDPHFRDYVWFHEVSFDCSFHPVLYDELFTLYHSTSTPTMAGDLARRTKPVGPVLLHTISSRVESVVVCRKHPEVIIFSKRNDP